MVTSFRQLWPLGASARVRRFFSGDGRFVNLVILMTVVGLLILGAKEFVLAPPVSPVTFWIVVVGIGRAALSGFRPVLRQTAPPGARARRDPPASRPAPRRSRAGEATSVRGRPYAGDHPRRPD